MSDREKVIDGLEMLRFLINELGESCGRANRMMYRSRIYQMLI